MGRWAQQHRRGGGGATPPTSDITQMTAAPITDTNQVTITLSSPVLSVPFVAGDHADLDSGGVSTAYGFVSPGVFTVDFDQPVSDSDAILYSAPHAGYATPQNLVATA